MSTTTPRPAAAGRTPPERRGNFRGCIMYCTSEDELECELSPPWIGGVGFCDKGAKGRGGC